MNLLTNFAAMKKGTLYLIPSLLAECNADSVFPGKNREIIYELKHFLVEDIRTTRRFLKFIDRSIEIDSLSFSILDKNTSEFDLNELMFPLTQGHNMGVISEAGCPGVADPGALAVAWAHRKGCKVIPLIGPSSILLALMASGFNGQSFTFHGYLPINQSERGKSLKELESNAIRLRQTQIFIETPYRNNSIFDDIIKFLSEETLLCIACNVTANDEFIATKSIAEWKKSKPDLNKKPSVFLIYR